MATPFRSTEERVLYKRAMLREIEQNGASKRALRRCRAASELTIKTDLGQVFADGVKVFQTSEPWRQLQARAKPC